MVPGKLSARRTGGIFLLCFCVCELKHGVVRFMGFKTTSCLPSLAGEVFENYESQQLVPALLSQRSSTSSRNMFGRNMKESTLYPQDLGDSLVLFIQLPVVTSSKSPISNIRKSLPRARKVPTERALNSAHCVQIMSSPQPSFLPTFREGQQIYLS